MITKEFKEMQAQAEANGEEINILNHPEMLGSPADLLKELKSRWLVDFIAKNGFDYLMTIMRTIVNKYMEADKSEILSKKAEVATLRLAAYLIKVILISCFC